MVFKANGTVDVYKVKKIEDHLSLHIDDLGGGWKKDYYTIEEETFLQNYTIPTGCSLVFSEDKLWIDGTIKDKVTVVAADVSQPNYDPDVIINGNIDYTTLDGSDGLTVVAENSIVLGVEIPSDISLRGIYVAQKGYFGRNLYGCWHAPHDQKNSLTMSGTIVSNGRVVTKWGYSSGSCGSTWSGFNTRTNSYDAKLAVDPPPLTPYVDDEFSFVEWREER